MKIFLSPSTQDWNAYKGRSNEEAEMNHIVDRIVPLLEEHKHKVKVGGRASWSDNVKRGNDFGAELYVAVHSNAGGGEGTEVWHFPGSAKGRKLAVQIYGHLAPVTIGKDRGVKSSNQFGELSGPNAPSVIIEVQFHDNAKGAADIREHHQKYAKAIAAGILDIAGRRKTTQKADKPKNPGRKPARSSQPVLKEGKKGSAVVRLQKLLKIKADGDFGPNTKKHVIEFQKAHDLEKDGIVGPTTWKALLK